MTSNEVGGTAGTAAASPSASPFLVDASAGAGASIFGTANPIQDLITTDYQDPNCCVWRFDCSKFVAIAPWHPTIDLAFARVSLSACALAALAACSTSHVMSSPCWSASWASVPLHHPQHKTSTIHWRQTSTRGLQKLLQLRFLLPFCLLLLFKGCPPFRLPWACCFAWSSYSRLAPLNLVEQGIWHLTTGAVFIEKFLYVMPNWLFVILSEYPIWTRKVCWSQWISLLSRRRTQMLPAVAPLLAVLLFALSGRHAPCLTGLGLPYKLFIFAHACQQPRAYHSFYSALVLSLANVRHKGKRVASALRRSSSWQKSCGDMLNKRVRDSSETTIHQRLQ